MIYLDHAATTPVAPTVIEAMLPHMTEGAANASSAHGPGRRASQAVDRARAAVAELLGAPDARLVFTSGATEALNAALRGLASARSSARDVLLVSSIEHKAVLDTAEWLGERGVRVVSVPVEATGVVDPDDVSELLSTYGARTLAIAVMAVNNETGAVQPVEDIAALAEAHGVPFVCDATQAASWGALRYGDLDGQVFLACSAHKLHGPTGIGCLVLPRKGNRPPFDPLITGGGQQEGLRSGTLNVPAAAGFSAAADWIQANDGTGAAVAGLRDRMFDQLMEKVGAEPTISSKADLAPHVVSVTVPGADAEALMANAADVAFSSGSACTSAVPTPSHVLTAMGMSIERAEQTVRFSLSRLSTIEDVDQAVAAITEATSRVRRFSGAA